MAGLETLLQQNGTFKSDLMQDFLSTSTLSFQEDQGQGNDHKPPCDNQKQKQVMTSEGKMGGKMGEMTKDIKSETVTTDDDPNAKVIDVDRIMKEVKQIPTDRRRRLMEQMMEAVGGAHMETVRPTYQSVAEANLRLSQMAADGNPPDMSKLAINPGAMWQEFVQSMVLEIKNVVRFCKKLPGFGDIDLQDQIVMIKKGSFEVLMVRMCMLVDHQKGEMFDPNMKMKCPRSTVKDMPMGFFLEEFFSVAEALNPLELTDKERGMFSAMLLMCPDRDGLRNKAEIGKLSALFNQSMFEMMKRHHPDYENIFAKIVGIVPIFRTVNQKHTVALSNMMMQKAEMMKDLPELQKEVFDVSEPTRN